MILLSRKFKKFRIKKNLEKKEDEESERKMDSSKHVFFKILQ